MRFVCACGVDIQVHSPNCRGISRAITKVERQCLVDSNGPFSSYPNMWILCRWVPPQDLDDWVESMGSEADYPANGSYRPVSKGTACVAIPPRATPADYVIITQKVLAMMKEHREKTKEAIKAMNAPPPLEVPLYNMKGEMVDAPAKGAKFWGLRDMLKDIMRKRDPSSTVGYGSKSRDFRVDYSDRSLADQGSPLQRERAQQKAEQAEELNRELRRELPAALGEHNA